MADAVKAGYATKAKVEHAIRMARLAGIEAIGSIELRSDGTIRLTAGCPTSQEHSDEVEREIARWRAKRGR